MTRNPLFLLRKMYYLCRKKIVMTTVSITLENNSMVSALRNILSHLQGVQNVMVWENDVEIPNKKTLAAIKELQQGKGVRCKNVDELFERLNS
jgi:hypothetical protein